MSREDLAEKQDAATSYFAVRIGVAIFVLLVLAELASIFVSPRRRSPSIDWNSVGDSRYADQVIVEQGLDAPPQSTP